MVFTLDDQFALLGQIGHDALVVDHVGHEQFSFEFVLAIVSTPVRRLARMAVNEDLRALQLDTYIGRIVGLPNRYARFVQIEFVVVVVVVRQRIVDG